MEQRCGGGQEAARMADSRRIYLSHLVAELRHLRIHRRATKLSARTRAVKLAADLSLAMTGRGRSAWRQAIVGKYLLRHRETRCQRRVVNSKGNSQGKRKSTSTKARPCNLNAARMNSCRQLPGRDSGLTGIRTLFSRDNYHKEAGGAADSRMQTLRALVPGSEGLDTPIFLKECADYIVALKLQVQVMKELADCLQCL